MTLTGQLWLKVGQVLNLQVKCDGTPPHDYCIRYEAATYKQTANDTCDKWKTVDNCDFPVVHYDSEAYRMLLFVRNRVSQINREIAINVYQVDRQSQLSVIVVPVAFCLVAVILVVFGVAYYMQNKSRYLRHSFIYRQCSKVNDFSWLRFAVEVADFNFAETASVDMEYKTFRQRLVDDFRDLFTRHPTHADDTGSDTSLKYGPMT